MNSFTTGGEHGSCQRSTVVWSEDCCSLRISDIALRKAQNGNFRDSTSPHEVANARRVRPGINGVNSVSNHAIRTDWSGKPRHRSTLNAHADDFRSVPAAVSPKSKSRSPIHCRPRHQTTPITLLTDPHSVARMAGKIVLSSGGVVRGISNWGTFLLPHPARKPGAIYHHGHYFILRFDSNARTQHSVRRTLGLDPRMIRYSIVKMGMKLDEISGIGGEAEWPMSKSRIS